MLIRKHAYTKIQKRIHEEHKLSIQSCEIQKKLHQEEENWRRKEEDNRV